mmetsp:Transcript_1622/g.2622  ORF Transcript_1622/g.2622 Transcript_1622/m.2622 type:complete len:438 (+) Transcript_1622:1650-2963(+)
MVKLIFSLALLALASATIREKLVKQVSDTDGTWELLGAKGYAGTIIMNELSGSGLFYWLFEKLDSDISQDKTPLIFWLQGGPGCSGETGMLWERISPIYIDDNSQPQRNNFTWAKDFHVMTIDFPLGAGYSYAAEPDDMKNNTIEATDYLYFFLQKLAKKHPSWFDRDLYIFGESFGGHWVPGLAYHVLMYNARSNVTGRVHLPLKGIGMGDPWTDPYTQSQKYAEYAYNTGLINSDQKTIIESYENQVVAKINAGKWLEAEADWEESYDLIVQYSGGVNVYNMRKYGKYDMSAMSKWLNLEATKELLHVPTSRHWIECNNDVYNAFKSDIMHTVANLMPYILDNIRVLVYNGQDDLIVNSPGTELMIESLQWKDIRKFQEAKRNVWRVEGEVAGYAQSYNNLNYVFILKSGHMAPHDQPFNAREMVYKFVNQEPWN